jgi:integrase
LAPAEATFNLGVGEPFRIVIRLAEPCRGVNQNQSGGSFGMHFHDLRGSGATWAATAGATVRELMDRLGHTTPTMALRYQHATEERDRAIADRLGELFRAVESAPDERAPVVPIQG